MSFGDFRNSLVEQQRVDDLLAHLPCAKRMALDVGTRDGYIAVLLAERFDYVAALDLVKPTVVHPKVACVRASATALPFPDGAFDLVLCSEVLEHIPGPSLTQACRELVRVTASQLLIGVPYKQDLRCGRTLCQSCGHRNPPWSHVNSFDEDRLGTLSPHYTRSACPL